VPSTTIEKRYLLGESGCGQGIMESMTLVDDATEAESAPRRRFDRGLLIASFVIACGAVLIIWGMFDALTGDEGIDRPDAIESLSPVENAVQVLQQEGIIVDFQYGYESRLFIDGIEIPVTPLDSIEVEPGQQIDLPPTAVFEPGNAVLTFQPTEGAPIEAFSEGLHDVNVIFFKTADGPDTARSYHWSFNVV